MKKKVFIEQNIEAIKKWQVKHEKSDTLNFKSIRDLIAALPTEESIKDAIAASVKITVNGKIDAVSGKVDMVGEHLKRQDAAQAEQAIAIQDLSKKIRPFDQAKNWVRELAQVILYVGGLAIAVAGIVELLKLFHVVQ